MKYIFYLILLIDIIFSNNLIKYEEIEKISIITFNNQNELNKFDISLLKELNYVIDSIDTNKINVLIITGEGKKSFSIGSKPEEINKMEDLNKKQYNYLISKIFEKIENLPIPVIAIINGLAINEGFELAVCCDFIICSENTVFGFKEENKNIFYEFKNPQRLLNFIDKGIAQKIILTKYYINAYEAYQIGLVNSFHNENILFEEGIKLAKQINKNSITAVKNCKQVMNEGSKIFNYIPEKSNKVTFLINIFYEEELNQPLYLSGNTSDFGNWTEQKYVMEHSKRFIWKTKYTMDKSSPCIQYKFVGIGENFLKKETGENRLLCPNNLENLPQSLSGSYILNLVWNQFHINFNLHYPIVPPNAYIKLHFEEAPKALKIWDKNNKKAIKMDFKDKMMIKNENEISGMWTISIPVMNAVPNDNYLDFEYKYSLFNPETNINLFERGPNRKIRIFLNEKNIDKEKNNNIPCFLLKNSQIDLVDVNFVAFLDFDKIGDKNIYLGVYPENEQDFELLSKKGINTILNIQTDKDLEYRQLDINILNKFANKYGIKIERYPIEDFSIEDLSNKLKDAGDLLNKLIEEGKNVYVHCTAGIGRSPSVVVTYLVLYENYSVIDAISLCKKYRAKINPNFKIIKEIAKKYKS